MTQPWRSSYRADPRALPLADRHYNRQSVGSPQFVPPGRCTVLLTDAADAPWVTSWPLAEYVAHAWRGAWINSLFRNESSALSSALITAAVAATYARWPAVPDLGFVTFIDPTKVRRKRDPGRCYLRAGWRRVGSTKGGLITLQLTPDRFPPAVPARPRQPIGGQLPLFDGAAS